MDAKAGSICFIFTVKRTKELEQNIDEIESSELGKEEEKEEAYD